MSSGVFPVINFRIFTSNFQVPLARKFSAILCPRLYFLDIDRRYDRWGWIAFLGESMARVEHDSWRASKKIGGTNR